jgi:signal transduction histidine kinase
MGERALIIGAGASDVHTALERRGVEVAYAATVEEACARLDRWGDADLVVCEATLCLELVPLLRERWAQIEVAVSAEDAAFAEAVPWLSEGAIAVVRSPLDPAQIDATLARAAERRRLRASEVEYQALQAALAPVSGQSLPEALLSAWRTGLSAERACLLLPGGAEGRLAVAYTAGGWERLSLPPAWIAAALDRIDGPAVLHVPRDEAFDAPTVATFGTGLVHPVRAAGQIVAVLAAQRVQPPFGPAELRRAASLGRHARVALENADLLRRLGASDRLASLGQLAASIAHEIRTPLNYVLENARLLAEKAPDGEAREAARDVVEGASRIRDLVRDVGAVASADETTRAPFDLRDAVRSAMRMAQAELRGRVEVFLRLGGELPVLGSLGRVTQIFVNLLLNAAQAIPRDRRGPGKVVVALRRQNGRAIAEVADDGNGIAGDDLPRIFEAFFTTKGAADGTGLGLFLSRDIARRHGGELKARSTPGHGSTFILDLPEDAARVRASDRGDAGEGEGSRPA